MDDSFSFLGNYRLVPVIAIHDAAVADPLGDALLDGGLPIAKVTFRIGNSIK